MLEEWKYFVFPKYFYFPDKNSFHLKVQYFQTPLERVKYILSEYCEVTANGKLIKSQRKGVAWSSYNGERCSYLPCLCSLADSCCHCLRSHLHLLDKDVAEAATVSVEILIFWKLIFFLNQIQHVSEKFKRNSSTFRMPTLMFKNHQRKSHYKVQVLKCHFQRISIKWKILLKVRM